MGRHGGASVAQAVLVSALTPNLVQAPDNPDGVPRGTFDQMVESLEKDRPSFPATCGKQFFGAGLLNFTVTSDILQWASMMALLGSPKATQQWFIKYYGRGRSSRHRLVTFRTESIRANGGPHRKPFRLTVGVSRP